MLRAATGVLARNASAGARVGSLGRALAASNRRTFADIKKEATPPILPGGENPNAPPVPTLKNSIPAATAPTQVPPTPPPPPAGSPPAEPKVTAPPPPPPPKKKRRIRRFLLTLTTLLGLAYAGGVYYSLISDNFHDFFTEYAPYGEEVVRYLEERDFKKRFPTAFNVPFLPGTSSNVSTISRESGVSELKAGPHISGTRKVGDAPKDAVAGSAPAIQPKVIGEKPIPPPTDKIAAAKEKSGKEKTHLPTPEAEPRQEKTPVLPPVAIAPIEVNPDDEPEVVQLAKNINDVITLVTGTAEAERFLPVIDAARSEINGLRVRFANLKNAVHGGELSEQKLKEIELEYAKVAEVLAEKAQKEVEMAQSLMVVQAMDEVQHVAEGYKQKTERLLNETKEMYDIRLQNALLEQSKELKRRFADQIEALVENERNGRLGKIEELSKRLNELEEMTAAWDQVVDAVLKTQHLQVALDTVKAAIEDPEQPKPFLKELAALKEVANDDELVKAAIASINPRAYQQGIATPTDLVDRFRSVAEEVRKAALLPENAGVAGHAASYILNKVTFRKKGLPTGDDVESILTRTETFLEEGNIDAAAREMNQLQGWSRILARDWLREARLLLEVRQAVEVIGIEARLRALQVEQQKSS